MEVCRVESDNIVNKQITLIMLIMLIMLVMLIMLIFCMQGDDATDFPDTEIKTYALYADPDGRRPVRNAKPNLSGVICQTKFGKTYSFDQNCSGKSAKPNHFCEAT